MIKNIASRLGKNVNDMQSYTEKRLDKFAEIVNTTEPLKAILEKEAQKK